MANMSYCRFENMYRDLRDCHEAMESGENISNRERDYMLSLLKLCKDIADESEFYGLDKKEMGEARRTADKIDGYDRDDLGESPDH